MRIALTGTPGTGKTSIARILEKKYKVVYLKEFEDSYLYYDSQRDSYVVDIELLKSKINEMKDDFVVIESHYSHEMPVDLVIVLRCHPNELKKRLECRGYSREKIMENVEAEAMGLITTEAISYYGKDKVFEVDTTEKSVEESAKEVEHVIKTRDKAYHARINYMGEILKWY